MERPVRLDGKEFAMPRSKNGAKPQKSAEEVAVQLKERLVDQLGEERTAAIWRDPTQVEQVVEGEDEAASVAEILKDAYDELPAETEEPVEQKRGRGRAFRRGLQIAIIAAMAVWAMSVIKKQRAGSDEVGAPDPSI
jgi:hypothetical protein